jgi:pyridoxal biosynthesis lyase PdxS
MEEFKTSEPEGKSAYKSEVNQFHELMGTKGIKVLKKDRIPHTKSIKMIEKMMVERTRTDLNLMYTPLNEREIVRFPTFMYE